MITSEQDIDEMPTEDLVRWLAKSHLQMVRRLNLDDALKVSEFAKAKGVDSSTVYRWEAEGKIRFCQDRPKKIPREYLTQV